MLREPWRRGVWLGAVLFISVGCSAVETPTIETSSSCIWDEPLGYSRKGDTPETVRGIIEHNAALAAVCKDKDRK
jgi:hypothetical protein